MKKTRNGPRLAAVQGVAIIKTLAIWIGLALLHIFAILPNGLKKMIASVSGWLMWHLNGRSRKITVRNLELCFPDMPEEERIRLARRSLFELNLTILDAGRNWFWQPERLDKLLSRVVGMDDLQAAIKNGSGAIVMAPHLGNWEFANLILCKYCDVTTMYKEPNTKIFGDFVREKRQRRGAILVPAGVSGCRAMLKALRAGKVVSLLPDQVPPEKFGKFAPFFGEPTLTITLVSNLIQRTGAKAIMAYCKRLSDGKYELTFRPVDEGVYDPDLSTSLAALNKTVERCVMGFPEQYQWEYKRFKYLPNLQKRNYLGKRQPGGDSLSHRQA